MAYRVGDEPRELRPTPPRARPYALAMTRVAAGRTLTIMLTPSSAVPLHRQIYALIRDGVLGERLKAGQPLPSTRALAGDLGVSRSTIVLAYDQLRAEGYLTSRRGGVTRVADAIPERLLRSADPPARAAPPKLPRPLSMSALEMRDGFGLRHALLAQSRPPRAFRSGVPALDAFPIDAWTRSVSAALRRMPPRAMSYGDTFGVRALREAVADYLAAARDVRCTAEQVMITGGSQQALSLCATVLLDRGDAVWLEDPFYPGARGVFELKRAKIVAVGVDAEGLVVDEGRRLAPDARAAFVTPSRQQPLGVTMSLARRLALLAWAREARSWIIEDDYDSEFRFTSRPLTALQGLDRDESVIYTGTFSKVMFPSLRLAYAVIPDALHDAFQTARYLADIHPAYLEQAALAEFMRSGAFERHVRRMRTMYGERMHALVRAADKYLGGRVRVPAADAGMTLVAWLRDDDDDVRVADAIRRAGVDVGALSAQAAAHRVSPGLLLGYSGARPAEIDDGVRAIARALERYDAAHRRGASGE